MANAMRKDAFPIPAWIPRGPGYQTPPERGMSLREWYAGQALATCADPEVMATLTNMAFQTGTPPPASIAKFCFGIADAMIEEGSKDE